jgi:hypothetical protein
MRVVSSVVITHKVKKRTDHVGRDKDAKHSSGVQGAGASFQSKSLGLEGRPNELCNLYRIEQSFAYK